eukprot:CAMPEP_0202725860 /NCGR_PEP_ID=MMETSP1385-20130828/184316_1 /ASSEMBLY_ACC=CAM_ASM_000861 /TAXON_ID=933848 /ORGANISM="Elphidium margaritaceum" /LENGTH=417 /DNA_ID=CAMNT_0049392065 /DNA_START=80 /DNA_END=1334 /DNA_ORIENTATION=+
MGQNCNGCCSERGHKYQIDTEIKNAHWADAVVRNKLDGVKMLHSENPDLINECVDNEGHKALHLCIRNKNNALLKYLLQHGVNINAKGGKLQNTALHEAIGVKDMNAVRYLFSFGIDDSIQNANGHRAIELCPRYLKREFMKAYLSTESIFEHNSKAPSNGHRAIELCPRYLKREFMKAKAYKNKQRTYLNCMQHREENKTPMDICIGGMSLRSTPSHTIRQYVNDYDGYDDDDDEDDSGGGYGHSGNITRIKHQEIVQRTKPVTTFGDRVGVDVDEIGMMLQKISNTDKLWAKWANKAVLTRQTEIYKILYVLTVLALRRKTKDRRSRNSKPPNEPIKRLTRRVCKKLPKLDDKVSLTKTELDNNLHHILYQLHDEMVSENSEESLSYITGGEASQSKSQIYSGSFYEADSSLLQL